MTGRGSLREARGDERGVVLPLTLMLLLLLSLMVVGLLALGITEPLIASNLLRGAQALGVAEAGAERAIAQFVATPSQVTNALTNCPTPDAPSVAMGTGTAAVNYSCNVGFATVLIQSTGASSIGSAQRVIRLLVTTQFIAEQALLGEAGVKVKTTSRITGELGSVHDNANTKITCTGGVCIEKTATSAAATCQNCTDPARVGLPASSGGNKPQVTLPEVSPMGFQADYVLGDDGKVYNGAGTLIQDTRGNNAWYGWTMGGRGEWVNDSDAPLAGTYYASKRIRIVGNPGSPGSPWRATLLSGSARHQGEVTIRGDAVMEPATAGLLIVAGKVRLKWTATEEAARDTEDVTADVAALADSDSDDAQDDDDRARDDDDDDREEARRVRPRNYMDLKGTITATSHKDRDRGRAKGRVKISGDVRLNGNVMGRGRIETKGATLTYNGANPPRLTGTLRVLSWNAVSP